MKAHYSHMLPVWVWIAFILISYPLFYFSYKYGLPDFGGEDFFGYYYLYTNWEFDKVDCPQNMRLISSAAIYLLNKAGVAYNSETMFSIYHSDYDAGVFFSALFFNYVCVLATCFVIYHCVVRATGNPVYSFMAGVLFLLGYGTLFFALKPISDACGIFLVALAFYFFLRRSYWTYVVLFLSLFQREYVFMAFSIIGIVDFLIHKVRFSAYVAVLSVVFFGVYILLRNTYFHTDRWAYQTSPSVLADVLFRFKIDLLPFIRQSLLLSNIFIIYLLVVVHKQWSAQLVDKAGLYISLLLFLEVVVLGFSSFGNNAGRYFYFSSPVLIYYLFLELKPLLSSSFNFSKDV